MSRTNQIAVLGYVFHTNHITEFGYIAPITAFRYCFLANDVMERHWPEILSDSLWVEIENTGRCSIGECDAYNLFLNIYSSQKVRHWYSKNSSLLDAKFWAAYRIKTLDNWKLSCEVFNAQKVSVWVWHVSHLVWSICTTRIMSWWVNPCVPIKVVIITSSGKERSATRKTDRFWYRSNALFRNLLHQFTRKWFLFYFTMLPEPSLHAIQLLM